MLKDKLIGAAVGACFAAAIAAGPSLAQNIGSTDDNWLRGVMKGMEMLGGKMKSSSMGDVKGGMTMSKPAMLIIDLKSGRMIQMDAAEAQKYFSYAP